jgi:hypothetical protein
VTRLDERKILWKKSLRKLLILVQDHCEN